jgi:hypothetical protein
MVPVAMPNPAAPSPVRANLAHLGYTRNYASFSFPLTPKEGSTTLAAALPLGTGATPARVLDGAVVGAKQIRLTTLTDLPTGGGVVSISGKLITYGKAELVEGIPTLLEVPALTSEIGAPAVVCRAAQVNSTEHFSATGGAIHINGVTYAVYTGFLESGSKKYLMGVSSNGGGEIASRSTVVDQLVIALGGPTDDYPSGPASAYAPSNNLQWNYEAFLVDRSTETFHVIRKSYMIGITHESGTGTVNSGSSAVYVTGGSRLAAEIKSGATEIELESTEGWPSSGSGRAGGTTGESFAYTGIAGKKLTGVTGITKTYAAGLPITPVAGIAIEAEAPVRPRFSPVTKGAEDKGLLAQSNGPLDPNGFTIGQSLAADSAGSVLVEI